VRRLAQEGAKVVLSSRKADNVQQAVKELTDEGLDVHGMVCHVGKKDQIQKLVREVS
jgi:dehydrogenase/reductase SDR family protein 4